VRCFFEFVEGCPVFGFYRPGSSSSNWSLFFLCGLFVHFFLDVICGPIPFGRTVVFLLIMQFFYPHFSWQDLSLYSFFVSSYTGKNSPWHLCSRSIVPHAAFAPGLFTFLPRPSGIMLRQTSFSPFPPPLRARIPPRLIPFLFTPLQIHQKLRGNSCSHLLPHMVSGYSPPTSFR